MEIREWDAVVIGGGVAGLSAAQMLGRARRRTLVIDAGEPRNRFAAHMHSVLGHDGIDPAELLARGRAEAARYGVVIEAGRAERIEEIERAADLDTDTDTIAGALRITRTDGTVDLARAVVLAAGVVDEFPEVAGLADRWGIDVLHCPYCHGFEVAGARLGVLATSPASVHQIELIRQWSDDVTAFVAAAEPLDESVRARLVARGIRIVTEPVTALEITGDRLVGVVTTGGDRYEIDALFTAPTPRLALEFADALALARTDTPGSPLRVEPTGATSHPRVWAAGNLVAPHGNVPLSMGSGSMAGAGANAGLVADDAERAVRARRAERNARWDERYAERDLIWSGRVNATTASIAEALPRGSVLEIGCGEGADAVWFAEHGWTVTATDVSATAIARATAAARERGLSPERIAFETADAAADATGGGADTAPVETYDLVVSSFLHSWEEDFPRIQILRDGASRVAPGGHMLVVSHAAAPPWSRSAHAAGASGEPREAHADHPAMRTPEEEVALLALDPLEWTVELSEVRAREALDREGNPVTLDDGVLLLRRR